MTITGKFIQALPTVEGESTRGRWVRGGFVIEYGDDYPRKVCFSLFGEERCRQVDGIKPGTMVQVEFQPDSREFNGKWYTELQCFRVVTLVEKQ